MNREIKFRGKDYNGKWRYGLLPYKNQIREFTNHEFIDPSEIEYDTCVKTYATIEDISILSETLGQFVGILDKNDKEIYEGDIVKDNESGVVGVVEFFENLSFDGDYASHPGFYCKEWTDYGDTSELSAHCGFWPNCEVIGNVFDNPELLKGYKHD